MILNRSYHCEIDIRAILAGDKRHNDYEILADDLVVILAMEGDRSIASVGRETVERWGEPWQKLMEQARQNLIDMGPPEFAELSPGLYGTLPRTGNLFYMATPESFADLDITGDLVVVPSSRDIVMMTGSGNTEVIELLADKIGELEDVPHRLRDTPYVFDGHEWRQFMPEAGTRAAEAFAVERARERVIAYATQETKLCDVVGDKVYVGKYEAGHHKDTGQLVTIAGWYGMETMMAEAANVRFCGPGTDDDPDTLGFVPWNLVREHFGHRMACVEGLYPPRWVVGDLPPESELTPLLNRAPGP